MRREAANIMIVIGFACLIFGGCLQVASVPASLGDRAYVPGEDPPSHPATQFQQKAQASFAIALAGFVLLLAIGIALRVADRNGVKPPAPNPDATSGSS